MTHWRNIQLWARKNVLNNIVVFELFGAIPFAMMFSALFFMDGTLSRKHFMFILYVSFFGFAFVAILTWLVNNFLLRQKSK